MFRHSTEGFVIADAVIMLPRVAGASWLARSLVQEAVQGTKKSVLIDGRRMALHSESFAEALLDELAQNGVRQMEFIGGSDAWEETITKHLN